MKIAIVVFCMILFSASAYLGREFGRLERRVIDLEQYCSKLNATVQDIAAENEAQRRIGELIIEMDRKEAAQ